MTVATIWQNSCPDSYGVPAAAECRCAARATRTSSARPALHRLELVADPARDVEYLRERRALAGIEIERDEVGIERRLHAREPRVLPDRGELRHVEERHERAADEASAPGSSTGSRSSGRASMRTPAGGCSFCLRC